ncbi:MAG: family 16 glycoside hydrolase [Melioribacteraceae bacterium]
MKMRKYLIILIAVVFMSKSFGQTRHLIDVKDEVANTNYKDVKIKDIPMAMQCWTFRNISFMETLEKVNKLGIKYLEAYPGQRLLKDNEDKKFGIGMSEGDVILVKQALKKYGITLRAFGVTNFEHNEAATREVFEFVKTMGIKVLVTEPKYDDFSFIDKMVKEYNIKVAVHNHPKPSKYWNPETVLKNVEGLDKRIGLCGDIGHYVRSGINPVEALRFFKGRVYNIHLKDLESFGIREAMDVPFGSGKSNIHDVLAELTLQNYRGTMSVEHERKDEQPDPSASIAKGLEYIKSIIYYKGFEEILRCDENGNYNKHGWNHYGPGYFVLDEKEGVLTSNGGMGLYWYSAKKYENFILDLEFKSLSPKTNSGVFIRVPNMLTSNDYIHHSFEIQIADGGKNAIHTTGAVYDAEPAKVNAVNPAGEWNHYRITNNGNNIKVELNGKLVNDWNEEPRGKIKDFSLSGYVGLQNHDSDAKVSFRNIFVKELK